MGGEKILERKRELVIALGGDGCARWKDCT